MLHKMGHSVFSVGHYTNVNRPVQPTHDLSHLPFDEDTFNLFCKLHDYERWCTKLGNLRCGDLPPYVIRLKKEFVDLFDIVFIVYYEENLSLNWEVFKNKPVILYAISQMQYHRSPYITRSNVKTVHMSGKEHAMHGYKPLAVIRHAVDCEYYKGYIGVTDEVLTCNKWLKKRGAVSAFSFYEQATAPFNRIAAGFGNEDLPYGRSSLSEAEL